ncbi:MAG: sugar phosphate isomerase/epimerase [Lentisphaerae bacterium]|jgi:sugar phosphate isomerase/epimerase|nr:sugar phosphate isomerase/epimerase [Lentisphaerota bacterium]MBT4820484.1 sugar phosphate isomerase/epimerase [Lentisphaerota bacterium]MBT5612481.1 sugar phosphate isomerase/epimerase [Lentisphaerota bacterium]MBT7061908.1 sugar phosphate isomerase/epimerase [Lentisphaerota bacterium]MBT7845976.1 sugar phosphate isomerase/epimerase [Lentisphaerota bacterium]
MTASMPKLTPPAEPAQLNLCLQWGAIPGGEINEKLDFLEANGFNAVEIPSGDWPIQNCDAMLKAMEARNLSIATACGPSDFSYAEPERREAEVQKHLPTIEALGALGSVGLVLCPARGKVPMGFKELREDFVTNTGKRLAEHAVKHGTSIVLEPLRRNETPFLRQVADGARIAADIGPGATVMGDFWHMGGEETSFMGAFICAGDLLSHVHVAGLKERIVPGVHPEADNYVDGFRGLKMIGYRGAISLEGGWPKDPDDPTKPISQDKKIRLMRNMVELLREQWAEA